MSVPRFYRQSPTDRKWRVECVLAADYDRLESLIRRLRDAMGSVKKDTTKCGLACVDDWPGCAWCLTAMTAEKINNGLAEADEVLK